MASLAEPLQGGPYPDPDDDNDIPNDLRQIVEWAAERSVMRFTDEAERDSLLPTPTEGMLCVTDQGTALQVWVYQNSDWRAVWTWGQSRVKRTTYADMAAFASLESGVSVSSALLIVDEDLDTGLKSCSFRGTLSGVVVASGNQNKAIAQLVEGVGFAAWQGVHASGLTIHGLLGSDGALTARHATAAHPGGTFYCTATWTQ